MNTLLQHLEEKNRTRIASFDFDNTLAKTRRNSDGTYAKDENKSLIIDGINEHIKDELMRYHSKGYKIIIVTARPDKPVSRQQVEDFVKQYELPISRIYFTEFRPKWHLLKKIPIEVHYDDDEVEVEGLRKVGKNVIKVDRLQEAKNPDIDEGDVILTGKWRNSPATVRGFGKDKHNQPTVKTNKSTLNLYKFRIKKLMDQKSVKESVDVDDTWGSADGKFTGNVKDLVEFANDYKTVVYPIENLESISDVVGVQFKHVKIKHKGEWVEYAKLPSEEQVKTKENENKRIENVDLSFPIIIETDKNSKPVCILDGNHRYSKAKRMGKQYILAKLIPLTDMERFKI